MCKKTSKHRIFNIKVKFKESATHKLNLNLQGNVYRLVFPAHLIKHVNPSTLQWTTLDSHFPSSLPAPIPPSLRILNTHFYSPPWATLYSCPPWPSCHWACPTTPSRCLSCYFRCPSWAYPALHLMRMTIYWVFAEPCLEWVESP